MIKKGLHGHPKFYQILEEIAELHSTKNADYAEKGKPLGNFERVAHWIDYYGLLNTPYPTKVLVAIFYKLKQLDCFLNAIGKGKKLKVEGLKERLRDDETYSMLIEILLDETSNPARKEGILDSKVIKKTTKKKSF